MVSASHRILPILVLVCTFIPIAYAQRGRGPSLGGNTRGRSTPNTGTQLFIQVHGENSSTLDMQLAVDLISSSRPTNNTIFTDINGRAQLSVPGPGIYQVRISGPAIQDTTSESILIEPGEAVHQEYVTVKLKTDAKNTAHAPSGDATISASQLNVPEKARKEYTKGLEEMHKQNWSKAREHFAKATRDYDRFDWAYNALGVVCMAGGDKAAARDAFAKAVEINDHNASAERNLARILIGDGDFIHAEEHARHSLLTQPQDADALILAGYAQLKQGKFDDALLSVRRVHSADKHPFPLSHLIAARALEAKQMKMQAAAEYRMYLSESPNAPEATLAREGLQRTGEAK